MNNILISKNEAYGAGANGTVSTADLPTLKHGALVIVGDAKNVIDATGSNASGVRYFQFILGIAKNSEFGIGLQNSVPIYPSQVRYVNYEKYKEPVTQIVKVGPFPSAAGDAQGELGLNLNNESFIRTIHTDQLRINEYKKSSTSLIVALNKIVDRINTGAGLPRRGIYKGFLTAKVIGTSDADYALEFEMKSEHVDFTCGAYGLFEGADVTTTRKAVISKGRGTDVARAEIEYSGNLGNGGYHGRNEVYYSKPAEAVGDGKYDIFTIQFDGMHDTPQNKVRAAVNWISVCVPTGSALVATLQAVLSKLIPSYIPAKDEADETDEQIGVVGN